MRTKQGPSSTVNNKHFSNGLKGKSYTAHFTHLQILHYTAYKMWLRIEFRSDVNSFSSPCSELTVRKQMPTKVKVPGCLHTPLNRVVRKKVRKKCYFKYIWWVTPIMRTIRKALFASDLVFLWIVFITWSDK